jgi:NADPH-dependent 7-cyano-7-deazaguanine reductase QueF
VYARFLRRGGLDINPFRTDAEGRAPARLRAWRQ